MPRLKEAANKIVSVRRMAGGQEAPHEAPHEHQEWDSRPKTRGFQDARKTTPHAVKWTPTYPGPTFDSPHGPPFHGSNQSDPALYTNHNQSGPYQQHSQGPYMGDIHGGNTGPTNQQYNGPYGNDNNNSNHGATQQYPHMIQGSPSGGHHYDPQGYGQPYYGSGGGGSYGSPPPHASHGTNYGSLSPEVNPHQYGCNTSPPPHALGNHNGSPTPGQDQNRYGYNTSPPHAAPVHGNGSPASGQNANRYNPSGSYPDPGCPGPFPPPAPNYYQGRR